MEQQKKLFPVRRTLEGNEQFVLPVRRAAPGNAVELTAPYNVAYGTREDVTDPQTTYFVPDVKSLARQLRGSSSSVPVPDIKTTAVLLRAEPGCQQTTRLEEQGAHLLNVCTPDITSIARSLRPLSVNMPVPDIRSTARMLRQVESSDFMPMFDADFDVDPHEAMDVVPHLEFTEIMQSAYNPTNNDETQLDSRVECGICAKLHKISLESLRRKRTKSGKRIRPTYGPVAKAIIRKVRHFFGNLKRSLGECKTNTIFDSPRDLTAVACGVPRCTISVFCRSSTPQPTKKKVVAKTRKSLRAGTLKKHEARWGEVVKQAVHERLRAESDVTVSELRTELVRKHEDFNMSVTTLHRFLKALGFSYRINKGQRIIYEKSDLIMKRAVYLRRIAEARNAGDCLIYTDETWIFDRMVKKRGWNDNTIPRFPPASVLEKYSCGRTAGKNKGKRAIVISALGEYGVVPNCTKIVISGGKSSGGDHHGDMNHQMFEEWLKDAIPHMISYAEGRRVTVIMDNAPYHSRQLEKIPSHSSSRRSIIAFLMSRGIEVSEESSKDDLIAELDHFVESRGGLSRVRNYAVEEICDGFGVKLIRLPPFHPFFNPIELCWSQLKAHLTKFGKTSDKIETVRTRSIHWLNSVPASMASAWFRQRQ